TCRSTGRVTSCPAIAVETASSCASSGAFWAASSFPGKSHSSSASSVRADGTRSWTSPPASRASRVVTVEEVSHASASSFRAAVDAQRVLPALGTLAPLVVAGHRDHGPRARERAAEHPVGAHGLQARVDRPGTLVLRPPRMQPPAGEFETTVHLPAVDELTHHGGLRARGDAVGRFPLSCTVSARGDVGAQQPVTVECQRESSAHREPPSGCPQYAPRRGSGP